MNRITKTNCSHRENECLNPVLCVVCCVFCVFCFFVCFFVLCCVVLCCVVLCCVVLCCVVLCRDVLCCMCWWMYVGVSAAVCNGMLHKNINIFRPCFRCLEKMSSHFGKPSEPQNSPLSQTKPKWKSSHSGKTVLPARRVRLGPMAAAVTSLRH